MNGLLPCRKCWNAGNIGKIMKLRFLLCLNIISYYFSPPISDNYSLLLKKKD